jgi:hypothetical protein
MSEVVKVVENVVNSESETDPLPVLPSKPNTCSDGVCPDGTTCSDGVCCPDGVCPDGTTCVDVSTPVITKTVEKKPVAFLMDIESKAIVESLGDLENFSVSNLMLVLPRLMKHVENYKNLRGSQKRELVIKMIKHIIDITDGPGNDDVWDPILKQLVPGLIDTLIQVNDGKLRLRKKPLSYLKVFCCTGRPKVDA